MRVEYELDQWEWQGVTRSVDIDPEDYAGMSAEDITYAIRRDIRADAEQNLHLVYDEGQIVRDVLSALAESEDDDDAG